MGLQTRAYVLDLACFMILSSLRLGAAACPGAVACTKCAQIEDLDQQRLLMVSTLT